MFQCNLSDFLLPKHCAAMIAEVVNKKKRDKKKGKYLVKFRPQFWPKFVKNGQK